MLLGSSGSLTVNPAFAAVPSYDPIKDFAPTSLVSIVPLLLVTHPSLPVANAKEFIALAKAKPGTVMMASAGTGSNTHLTGELFQVMTGVKFTHVPYKGSGPALVDLLAGQINLMFTSTTSGAVHVKSGRLKAIAVTSGERVPAYPDLPTLAETVAPGYELENKYCLYALSGTPKPILALLNREVSRIVNSGDVKDKFAADGANPAPPISVDQFKNAYLREVSKWEQFTRNTKLKL